VDRVSKLWEDIFTTFPVDSRSIRFEYITRYILTTYTTNCDDGSTYNSRLSTTHKARVVLGGNTTITVVVWLTISLRLRWCTDSRAVSLQDRGSKAWWGDGKCVELCMWFIRFS
jgi:hypothetical protein